MNDLTTRDSGALVPGRNFFEQYEEASNGNRIVGDFLKFSKGDWLYGRDSLDMPKGARLIVNVAGLKVGWQRWEGGKPSESVMGLVMDGFSPPARASLGDTDKDLWERDEQTGQPRDPWQATNTVVLKDEKGDALYTFSTSSKGGIGAIAKVAGEYGRRMRAHPTQLPVVTLDVESYQHPNKAYGRIKNPKFVVVGWVEDAGFKDALAADQSAAEDDSFPGFDDPAPTRSGRSSTQF